MASAELLATSGQKVELETYLQKEIVGFAAEIEERAELRGRLDAAIEGGNMLKQALADCREAALDAKHEGIHKLEALQESAKITPFKLITKRRLKNHGRFLLLKPLPQPVAWTL